MRRMISLFLALLITLSIAAPDAMAASAKVAAKSAGIYKRAGAKKAAGTLKRGATVTVLNEGKTWLKVRYKGNTGYVKKSAMKKVAESASKATKKKPKYRALRVGSSGAAVKKLQKRLAAKGYLPKSAVTGKYGEGTRKAVRIFQMFNSLSISGTATAAMQKKLFSSSARTKPKVSIEPWSRSDINSRFPNRSTATIIDIETGTRISTFRLYGTNHCDVEPKTKADTARLKSIYGGEWSWDSRGVLLIAGGKCYAAAINSEPHGGQTAASNNYPGQFCLHLKDSKTHGTQRINANHQANIVKVYNYFK